MYTQCPDCSTAFRVTAEVLKQAAGKVRCGGCGNAFNALEYLSESMPDRRAPKTSDEILPELKPEPTGEPGGLPESISAEQSAALLKTLDELAGSDIRIEDTGVEWRVLDDDEVGDSVADSGANEESAEAVPANDMLADEIDEFLEESPTPVDQFLTDTPPEVDSPEIFAEAEPAKPSLDELRFDDNTPLPDDFELEREASTAAPPEDEPAVEEQEPVKAVEEESQPEFDLSEPDEWTDILDEFEDLAEAVAVPAADVAPLEAELDLLDELAEDDAEDVEAALAAADEDTDEPLDMDSQFALQAEAMGIDLSGMHESPEEPEEAEDINLELMLEDGSDRAADIEGLLDEDVVDEVSDEDTQLDLIEAVEEDLDAEPEEEPDEQEAAFAPDDAEEPEAEDELELEAVDEIDIPPLTEEEQTINMQIDQDLMALAVEDEDGFASTIIIPGDASAEDALEKDRKKGKKKKDKKKKKKEKDKKSEPDLKDTSAGFETIIMEGTEVRSALDDDKFAKDAAAAASLAGAAAAEREAEAAAAAGKRRVGMIIGSVALVVLLAIQVVHQSREALATYPAFNNIAGPLYRAIGMPLSPDWDITGWRFEATRHSVGEVDASDTEGGSEDVMIFSRIGNNSDKPLPYPVIGISLTDRYEEPIGGYTLDPADYLPDDQDPRKLVDPGDTFNAVMTIRSPSAEAASFRLRACYRNADGSMRCKDDSFK